MRLEFLIALVVLLAVAAGAALFLSWREDPLQPANLDLLKTLFAPRSHDFKQLSGGLLVHTMTIADVARLLDVEDFVLEANDSAITDCSFPDADLTGSCSAWTYLRSDLMPMIYNTPTQVNSSGRGDWDDAGKRTRLSVRMRLRASGEKLQVVVDLAKRTFDVVGAS